MTLTVLAAVTILVVGLFTIVSRERQVSTSFDAVEQADLAVRAGLEHVEALLKSELADETGLIVSIPLLPAFDEKGRPRTLLTSARHVQGASPAENFWRFRALAAGVRNPPDGPAGQLLTMPGAESGGFQTVPRKQDWTEEERRMLQALPGPEPWQARPERYWIEMTRPAAAGEVEHVNGEAISARYTFYIEDMQGRISLDTAGNHDPGRPDSDLQRNADPAWLNANTNWLHARTHFPADLTLGGNYHVVPGLNLHFPARPLLNQVSLHTLLQPTVEPRAGEPGLVAELAILHRRLVQDRRLWFSPGQWREALLQPDLVSGWTGLSPQVLRERFEDVTDGMTQRERSYGSLMNPAARVLEESTMGGIQPYDELALIPPDPAFLTQNQRAVGERKLNLNALLWEIEQLDGEARQTRSREAVEQIAAHIHRLLIEFGSARMGGFPLPLQGSVEARALAYLRNLAAGMLDYADTDSLPTMDAPSGPDQLRTYRGIDSYPLVSEQWQRYRFEGSETVNGASQVRYSVTHYMELWNMSNQPVSGAVTAAYEINGDVSVGFAPYALENALDMVVSGRPVSLNGLPGLWHEPRPVQLMPNEYLVIAFEPVVYRFPIGGRGGTVTNVDFRGRDSGGTDLKSRYRLAFRPPNAAMFTVVDQPMLPVERYTRNVSTSTRQRFNTTHPGMSYAIQNNNYANNVGDPRAAFYINYHQDVVNYDGGSSPWARNLRHNISGDPMYKENRVFMWPDGGHDSVARTGSIGSLNRNPDDPSLRPAISASQGASDQALAREERLKYVQRLSNTGRFFSVTELGHIFDPIMWDPNGGSEFDTPRYADFASLRPGNAVRASDKFCGGNTLRIGRPEHPRFRADYRNGSESGRPANRRLSATALLDLFHCGMPGRLNPATINPAALTGDLIHIDGHVNLNTATRDALRALVAGRLLMDAKARRSSANPEPNSSSPVDILPATTEPAAENPQADIIADAIIAHRPYLSPAELAEKVLAPRARLGVPASDLETSEDPVPVFGFSAITQESGSTRVRQPEWNDSAAEELFARVFNGATVRSRNFKVVVTGQALRHTRSGELRVLATRSRVYHVFVRPIRDASGNLVRQNLEITYARNL